MDGSSTVQHRDIERVFQGDRHSDFVLATVFERLSTLGKSLEPQRHLADAASDSPKPQLQEAS